jgi:hypothetical protein
MSAPVVVRCSSSSRLRRLRPRALVPETLGDGDATGASWVVVVGDKVNGWVLNNEPAYLSSVAGFRLCQEAFIG